MARGARDVTAVPRPLQGERKESLGKGEKRVETQSWRGQSTAGRGAGSFSLLLLFFKAIVCFLWSLRPGEHRGALHIKHSVAWLRCTQCPQPLHPQPLHPQLQCSRFWGRHSTPRTRPGWAQHGEKRDQTSVMPLLPSIPCWSCWGGFALSSAQRFCPAKARGSPTPTALSPF